MGEVRVTVPARFDGEWKLRRLGDLARIATGARNNQDKRHDGRYPFFVRSSFVERIDSFAYDCEAILIPGEGRIGDIFHYVHGRFDVHQRVYAITDFGSSVFARFLCYYMAEHFGAHALKNTVKATVDSLRKPTFLAFQVPVPPLPEQRAIAAVLSDVDELIGSLEALIAKKQAIKQAAMQELLTGRTRLPGFGGEWEMRRLGDFARIATGTRNNQDKRHDGRYPFFVRSSSVERIDSFAYDCEAILIPGEGRIGEIFHYVHGRFDVHQRVYAITGFASSVCARFLWYYMAEHFGAHALKNTVKATVDSLRQPTFLAFKLPLPPLPEQQAIATTLSDMDSEIAALDHRLDKTRAIKQGMMQQLLTGSIRLPIPDDDTEDDDAHDA
ncbi:MAG: restriction endonuclease subunit S [Gemmatimonadetes bacterium]|nr:restriction endonuclease subunit S [Gemmatimonadota bacterium]